MRRVAQIGAVTVVVALLGLLVWDLSHTKGGKVARDVDQNKVVARPEVDAPTRRRPRGSESRLACEAR